MLHVNNRSRIVGSVIVLPYLFMRRCGDFSATVPGLSIFHGKQVVDRGIEDDWGQFPEGLRLSVASLESELN